MRQKRSPAKPGCDIQKFRDFQNSTRKLIFPRTRERLARWLAPDLLWNREMSLELDRKDALIEELRTRVKELEAGSQ